MPSTMLTLLVFQKPEQDMLWNLNHCCWISHFFQQKTCMTWPHPPVYTPQNEFRWQFRKSTSTKQRAQCVWERREQAHYFLPRLVCCSSWAMRNDIHKLPTRMPYPLQLHPCFPPDTAYRWRRRVGGAVLPPWKPCPQHRMGGQWERRQQRSWTNIKTVDYIIHYQHVDSTLIVVVNETNQHAIVYCTILELIKLIWQSQLS